jgi:hypothetical protein
VTADPDRPAGRLPERLAALGRAPSPRTALLLVLGLCAVALALRLVGVSYGLPEYVYHEDTPKQIQRVPRFFRGALVPGDTYPTLHMYVAALLLRGLALLDPHAVQPAPTVAQAALVARLLNAALSAGLVALVYAIGRRLAGAPAGLLGAALLAVSSLHVLHAHHEMGDLAQTFAVTASAAAAAGLLTTGRARHYLLAGVFAGLAASAKYYGAIVLGTVALAALPEFRRDRRRGLGWLVAAGAVAAATFVLTTPKLLLTPLEFLQELQDAFRTMPPPPLARRPAVAGKALLGLSLEWFGPLVLGLAGLGVVRLLRAGRRGALALATPALVLGVYVVARSHRLDERNLLILTPFLYLAAGAGLVGIAGRSRPRALAAAALFVVALGASALDALHVASLFTRDDTRLFAWRWLERSTPPDPEVLKVTYRDSVAAYQALGADILALDSKEWTWDTAWYAPRPSPATRRALAFLEARGKLLKRFELLPRGFIAPTLAYYDLATLHVPYAFPMPEAVASPPEALVFLDPEAVPEPVGFVAEGWPVTVTLVSRAPLDEVTVALSGRGGVRVRQGWRTVRARVEPGERRLVRLEPRRSFPWYKRFYPITIDPRGGLVYVRLLPTPCDVARVHLAWAEWEAAAPALAACRTRWGEPARLLDLASVQARLARLDEARATLTALERTAPGLLAGLTDLARQPDGPAWRERYQALAGLGRRLWHASTARAQAEEAGQPLGAIVPRADAAGGRVLLARPDLAEAGYMKIWFPQQFLRGRYTVRFRLRGGGAGTAAPLATLSVVRHFQHAVVDVPATLDWRGAPDPSAFQEVSLGVETDLEPVKLEARVLYHGRGALEIDEVVIAPDVRRALAGTLEPLRPLLAP